MRVYCFQATTRRWVFYTEPQPARAHIDETMPVGWVGKFWRRLQRTYVASLTYVQTSPRLFWIWVRKLLKYLERFIHPTEALMRFLLDAETVEIHFPSDANQAEVERQWQKLLHRCSRRHGRGIIVNLLFLPLTAAATLLPGPNVFVGWNGLRLYGHVMARRGAGRALAEQIPLTFIRQSSLARSSQDVAKLTFEEAVCLEKTLEIEGLVEYLQRLKLI
ncbi:MAG: hypothetical protein K1Y36_19535 [Blastocatellia bacterium]|nr:hypothetical protein [Blastocatellia bacterium]